MGLQLSYEYHLLLISVGWRECSRLGVHTPKGTSFGTITHTICGEQSLYGEHSKEFVSQTYIITRMPCAHPIRLCAVDVEYLGPVKSGLL